MLVMLMVFMAFVMFVVLAVAFMFTLSAFVLGKGLLARTLDLFLLVAVFLLGK